MKTFHHGGRSGDLIYALWTMKKLGGGLLYLSDRQDPGEGGYGVKAILDMIPLPEYRTVSDRQKTEVLKAFWRQDCSVRLLPFADFLLAAMAIKTAKVFFGAVSSCHAIAEALGKPRFAQVALGCDNVNTINVNDWPAEKVVEEIMKVINGE